MLQDILRWHLPFQLPMVGNELVIHGYGVMLVIGFLLAMWLAKYLARRCGLNPEVFANAALIGLFAGVIGARLSDVLENLSDFTRSDRTILQNIGAAFDITSGGLTYYGGFLLATPLLILYAKWHKIPLRLGMDIIAPCLMIGLGIGRVGCYLNGCCYGAECHLPWAVEFPYGSYAYDDQYAAGQITPPAGLLVPTAQGTRPLSKDELRQGTVLQANPFDPNHPIAEPINPKAKTLAAEQHSLPVHPAELYSTFTALLLAGLLVAYFSTGPAPGMVFALMMILEGIGRFVLELLRVEPPVTYVHGYGLSLSMVLGIVISAAGILLALVFTKYAASHPSPRLATA